MYQKPNFYYIPFFIKFAIPGKILLGFLSSFMLESSSAVVEIMVVSILLNWFCFFLYNMEQNRMKYQLQIITTKVGYIKYLLTSNVAIDINLVN